jgi:predicted dehydrogenase
MTAAARAAGVTAVIDHELRVNPNRQRAAALIADGYVGRPRHVILTLLTGQRADPDRAWNWWADAEQGGGLLGANGSHQIDLLRHWLGEISAVTGGVETFITERPTPGGPRRVTSDDFTSFSLRFASGAVATIVLSVVATHSVGPRIEVWGDRGALWLDDQELLWGTREGGPREELTEPETLSPPRGLEYAPLWGLSFVRLVDVLVPAILDGGPVAPLATFEDGLAVQRVLDAIRQASGRWQPV